MHAITAARNRIRFFVFLSVVAACVASAPSQADGQEISPLQSGRAYPSAAYYSAFTAFNAGEFDQAYRGFRQSSNLGLRSTQGRWVDSICYFAMMGESSYQLGNYSAALDDFNAALQIFQVNASWMRQVRFPTAIAPDQSAMRPIPWGPSAQANPVGRFPNSFQILMGRPDNAVVVQQGGIVDAQRFNLINAHEVVRCTAIALRRRAELMGPACRHDPLSARLVAALDGRIGPVNHWSQAWINAQRGMALLGVERKDDALQVLRAATLVAGQYHHPLSAMVRIEIAKLAFEAEDYQTAAQEFFEATFPAAAFSQSAELEEAMRLGSITHMVTGQGDVYPPLAGIPMWAQRERFRFIQASALVCAADHLTHLRRPNEAAQALADAQQPLRRRGTQNLKLTARWNHQAALTSYQQGRKSEAETRFKNAVEAQQKVSMWGFHLTTVNQLQAAGALTERVATLLYERLLREPTAADWTVQPLDTLVYQMTPHVPSLQVWLEMTLARHETEKAIEIADRIRRHRFHSSLSMGGRLLSLRWVVDADARTLPENGLRQRQDFLSRYPKLNELRTQSQDLMRRLRQKWLNPEEEGEDKQVAIKQLSEQLARVTDEQEKLLGEISLKREACDLVFPPLVSTPEVQANLQDGELALIFARTSDKLQAFMLSRDKYGHWELPKTTLIRRSVASLLKAIGNVDENAVLPADVLASDDWKTRSSELTEQLIDRGQFGFWNRFDKLVVIPDDDLWNLPFEILMVKDTENRLVPLVDKIHIRYSPTAGLIVPDQRPRRSVQVSLAALGKVHAKHKRDLSKAQFAEWQAYFDRMEPIAVPMSGPSGILRSIWDELVVLDDINDQGRGPFEWSPAQVDVGKAGSSLRRWMELPWGGPEHLVLPGFHTAAENSLKRSMSHGDGMFLSLTGLMASGTRTMLVSRWRTGGQTGFDILREYLQESPESSPGEAWRRATLLTREAEVDGQREPRASSGSDQPIKTDHPFFWAGYMLLDRGAPAQPANVDVADEG